jgi:peptidoglycan/xylan/chitin deacetylase (PgdA/CDA1 family)
VAQLGKSGLVAIGAHTVTHPVLSRQSRPTQRAEIGESKRALEELVGLPVLSFAYPFGTYADVGSFAPTAAREAGFQTACINDPAPVTAAADLLMLPRFVVRDWPDAEFAGRLARYFES